MDLIKSLWTGKPGKGVMYWTNMTTGVLLPLTGSSNGGNGEMIWTFEVEASRMTHRCKAVIGYVIMDGAP